MNETKSQKFERIKGEVVGLTAKQKADLVTLLAPASTAEPEDNPWRSLVYSAASEVVSEVMGARPVPLAIMLPRISSELSQASAATAAFLTDHLPGSLRPSESLASLKFLAGLTREYMIDVGIPVTLRTLLQQLANVAQVFDYAFPGYAQSGLVRVAFASAHCLLSA